MAIFGFIVGLVICLFLTYATIAMAVVEAGFTGKISKLPFILFVWVTSFAWYLVISNSPFTVTVGGA